MESCKLCSAGRPGFVVVVGSSAANQELEESLGRTSREGWDLLPSGGFWISAQVVSEMAAYWSEYLETDEWTLSPARKNPDGSMEMADAEPWHSVQAGLPSFWIDDIIASSSIRMMCQPIVAVGDRIELVGYEMLARAFDETGGMIPPMELFKQAREQDRLFALDRECRIKGVSKGSETPSETIIFVNFIPTSIYNPENCLRTTLAAMKRSNVDPGRVVFEVVETDAVRDIAHLTSIFKFYRGNGIQCALDDVGTGFNGIEMLEALTPDVVKLDRSISDGIARDRQKQDKALAVLGSCNTVGARALAEGVETVDDAACLRDLGFVWQQGYLFGKPSFDVQAPQLSQLITSKAA